jgi:hypothetical protein
MCEVLVRELRQPRVANYWISGTEGKVGVGRRKAWTAQPWGQGQKRKVLLFKPEIIIE